MVGPPTAKNSSRRSRTVTGRSPAVFKPFATLKFGPEPRAYSLVVGPSISRTGRRTACLYSNAGDKPWQMVILSGTQRIQPAISEPAAAIC